MTRACHTAVRMATGDVFSDDEISAFLDRVANQARRMGKEQPTLSEREAIAAAAGAVTKEALKEALIARRLRVAADMARELRRAKIDAMPGKWDGAKRLAAFNVGVSDQAFGTSDSIDAKGRALQSSLWGQVDTGLKQMPGLKDRISNFFMASAKGIDRLIAKEMARLNGNGSIEPTGDEGALHAAQVFVKALSDARDLQNEQGAWIDKLPGYIARQSHDPAKVAGGFWREIAEVGRRAQANGVKDFDWGAARDAAEARSFGQWRDVLRPLLDPRTFEGLEMEDLTNGQLEDEAQESRQMARQRAIKEAQGLAARGIVNDPTDVAELMLHHAWLDITGGGAEKITGGDDLGDFRPSPSLARAVSRERVFHFKDPDGWMDYSEKYGRGLFATVMSQLERAGRNAALMKGWGPAPEAAFKAEVARLRAASGTRHGRVVLNEKMNPLLRGNFEQINGMADAPANMRFAQVMKTYRNWQAMTKLGGIMLSKVSDSVATAATFKRAGSTYLEGAKSTLDGIRGLQGEDAKRAAEAWDVGANAFAGHIGGQYSAADGAPGWSSYMVRLMYRVNGFEWANNGVQKGAAVGLSRFFATEAERPWDAINIGTRETFERFGITPQDWDAVRNGLTPGEDGKTYFTLDHLEDGRASADLRLKFSVMMHDLIADTTNETRGRERARMGMGTRPGTILGEIVRSFGQFKGFVTTFVGRHLVPAARGYAGLTPIAAMAHFIPALALAGYLSLSAKAIVRGEMPRDPVSGDPLDMWKTWGASLMQSGGLGLYGDFLFGELNRNGQDFDWGSLGGPIISDSEQVVKVFHQAIAGGAVSSVTGRSQIPGELVKIGSQNIPLINLWYTRLALDYLVLWRLQEAVSPGYLQRYEARVKNQEHASFLLAPTSALN